MHASFALRVRPFEPRHPGHSRNSGVHVTAIPVYLRHHQFRYHSRELRVQHHEHSAHGIGPYPHARQFGENNFQRPKESYAFVRNQYLTYFSQRVLGRSHVVILVEICLARRQTKYSKFLVILANELTTGDSWLTLVIVTSDTNLETAQRRTSAAAKMQLGRALQ